MVLGCPQNYVLNSVSRMCVRLVSEGKTWSEAKQYCESQGDTLAQFKTSESVEWLRNYIKNNAPESENYSAKMIRFMNDSYQGCVEFRLILSLPSNLPLLSELVSDHSSPS